MVSTGPYQSFSIWNNAKRDFDLETGSTGISGGCGNLSSKYSIITRESYNTKSRSTSVGTELYGFSSERSSGLLFWSICTTSAVISFSDNTIRVRWLWIQVGSENKVITDLRLAINALDIPGVGYLSFSVRLSSNHASWSMSVLQARPGRIIRLHQCPDA